MSTILMSVCWPLQGMSPAQKAVLISLADQANDDGYCWPSVKTISTRTCLSERAVQGAIRWLQEAGILGSSVRSGTSTVYQLTPAAYAPPQMLHPADAAPRGAGNAPPPPQMLHPTPADAAPKPSMNHQLNHHGTNNDGAGTRKRSSAKAATTDVAKPDGVTDQTWSDFLQLRKRVKAEVTLTALDGIAREAVKAGYTLEDALTTCCANGWRGFRADWVQPKGQRPGDAPAIGHTPRGPRPAPVSFAQQDREEAMCRWERMTGRVHPDRQQQRQHGGEIIDITPRQEPMFIGGRQ